MLNYVKGTGKFVEKYNDIKKQDSNNKRKIKRVLITGGAGFLGYHLSQRLRHKYDLIFLDIDVYNKDEYPKNSKLYNIDVRDKKSLKELFKNEKFDFIIHCAAALPLWNKEDIYSTNVQGTKNILDVALKNKIKRVVYISSTAVYGVPKIHPLYETSKLVGVGAYGDSKIKAEKVCERYRKKGLIVPIIRPKTFIGTARLGVFQILYDWVESGKKIPVIGNGNNKYQLLEVDDLVDSIDLTLTKPIKNVNDTFNVGAEEFGTINEFLGGFLKEVKTGSKIMTTPATTVKFFLRIFEKLGISPLYEWVYGTADTDSYVSIDKIKTTLGWKPKYSNKEALLRSYKWYKKYKKKLDINASGVTHRVRWKQGILGIFKKFM